MRLGFDACGIAEVATADEACSNYDQWIAEGCQAGMNYMERHRDVRLNPKKLLAGARSIISVALNYYPAQKLSEDVPHIAYYAYGNDYHEVMKAKLKQLSAVIDGDCRAFADAVPLFERFWAVQAGLGWIGKNSNLIIPHRGSYFFLGEIITTAVFDYDKPFQKDLCGTCHKCLDACPTGALCERRRVDARRCFNYLTIENHDAEIPSAEAAKLGNRFYGCDSCQIACPWNRFSIPTKEKAFEPSPDFLSLNYKTLKNLTAADYQRIFGSSAMQRAKYDGLIRNARYLQGKDSDAS